MQRKPVPGFPANLCAIRVPESPVGVELEEQDGDLQQRRRQQLINFAHSHWGFNNWSWAVTKQELDFVDFSNGKYSVGVAAFVSVSVRSLDISREDVGYATAHTAVKGTAIYKARKYAVTNALRETLLSFGGPFATELIELLESEKIAPRPHPPEVPLESIQSVANKTVEPYSEPKNAINNRNARKDSSDSGGSRETPAARSPHKSALPPPPAAKPMPVVPVAKAQPMPANQPPPPPLGKPVFPANQMPPGAPLAHVRPNSNVSFVLQPMMPGVLPPLYAQPSAAPQRMPLPHQHVFPNYYEYAPAPWHFAYEGFERHHGNVNLNFNIPPKNLVVNSRGGAVECKNSCGGGGKPGGGEPEHAPHPPHAQHPPYHNGNAPACWIKPTIFYDGFWTEQKVKKWVAEQVEKQFPEDAAPPASPATTLPPHLPA